MHIEAPRRSLIGDRARLTAKITWEDEVRAPQEVYFEVDQRHANLLAETSDAFLVGAATLAMRAGERRLAVDGACPDLAEGIRTAIAWLNQWYPSTRSITVEAPNHKPRSFEDRVAGSLLSGGVDSLAVLASNRNRLAVGHPMRIRNAVLVNWNVGTGRSDVLERYRFFEKLRQQLQIFAAGVDLQLVTVYSNLMVLLDFPRGHEWGTITHGAAFAGVSHALSGGLHSMSIGSSYDIPNLKPWGSHPLLDSNFSSGYLRMVHDGVRLSRIEKVRLMAEWPEALAVVNVCIGPYNERMDRGNCGRCEKCIRTALALLALGKLEDARTFGADMITPDSLGSIRVTKDVVASFWADLAVGLLENGHRELANVAATKVAEYERRKAIKGLDVRLTGGRLQKIVRLIRSN
jgi:hypothetical protein